MTDDKKFITPTGRFYSGGLLPSPQRMPAVMPRGEEVIPVGIDFSRTEQAVARMYRLPREAMEDTRQSFSCVIQVADNATASLKRFRDQLKFYQLRVYYGDRIAMLLTSPDRRQRKRGERLLQKRTDQLWAKALVQQYRDNYPEVRKFWETNLGEPYDPERYRKD